MAHSQVAPSLVLIAPHLNGLDCNLKPEILTTVQLVDSGFKGMAAARNNALFCQLQREHRRLLAELKDLRRSPSNSSSAAASNVCKSHNNVLADVVSSDSVDLEGRGTETGSLFEASELRKRLDSSMVEVDGLRIRVKELQDLLKLEREEVGIVPSPPGLACALRRCIPFMGTRTEDCSSFCFE